MASPTPLLINVQRYGCVADLDIRRADGERVDAAAVRYNANISAVEIDVFQNASFDRDVLGTIGPSPIAFEDAETKLVVCRVHFEKATRTLPLFDHGQSADVVYETVVLRGLRIER